MPSCWSRCKCVYLISESTQFDSSLKYKTKALTILLVTADHFFTVSIIHISRCMHVHSLSPVSRIVNPVVQQSVAVSDFPVSFIHLQSPPECLSICLSASCFCIALSKPLYKHKDRDASTCNFSVKIPMKHSSESSYYSFPIPPS